MVAGGPDSRESEVMMEMVVMVVLMFTKVVMVVMMMVKVVMMMVKVVMVVLMMAMEVMVAGGPNSRESEVMMEMVNKKRTLDSHFIDLLTISIRQFLPFIGNFCQIYNPTTNTWRPAASFEHTAFGPGWFFSFFFSLRIKSKAKE